MDRQFYIIENWTRDITYEEYMNIEYQQILKQQQRKRFRYIYLNYFFSLLK